MEKKAEKKEQAKNRAPLGSINIAPEVVEHIAEEVVKNFDNVEPLPWYKSSWFDFMSGDRVALLYQDDQNQNVMRVVIAVKYGEDVQRVALEIQRRIDEQVYFMTDIHLDKIDVVVGDLMVED